MPIYRGTRWDDQFSIESNRDWTIYGRGGNDSLEGSNGVDHIYGNAGNDGLLGWSGGDYLYGGAGDDGLSSWLGKAAEAWGGPGNDSISEAVLAVGGTGNDVIRATDGSTVYGDTAVGVSTRGHGNDYMQTDATSAGGFSTQTGGAGADQHVFTAEFDFLGGASACVVTDFQAGQDKIGMALLYQTPEGTPFGYLSSAQVWGIFDTNADGRLDGADVPWDGNSGTAVIDGNLHLRLHEDTLVIAHTTSITAGDWLFT